MHKILIGFISVVFIIYIIPFLVYGLFSSIFGLKTPEGVSPVQFLISIFIAKIGTAAAITLFFHFTKEIFYEKWLLYVFIWWILFLFGEIGQAIGPNYSWMDAVAGILSETIYLPVSVYTLRFILLRDQ